MKPHVSHVSLSHSHSFSKINTSTINLLTGLGVEGDAHCGKFIKHRSRLRELPLPLNLRQVHIIHGELFDELRDKGFEITAGLIGENITTRGIDLLNLPRHTKLFIGEDAIVEVTGLRNPCSQLNALQPGLTAAVLSHDDEGNLIRKSGIMSIVKMGGEIKPGDEIRIELPDKPFLTLERV